MTLITSLYHTGFCTIHFKVIFFDVHFKGYYSMWDLLTLFCFILSFQTFKCDLSFKDDLTKN